MLTRAKGLLLTTGARAGEATAGAGSALWTFPSVLLSAFVISWAAEVAQFFMSQGLALAVLAWLQTLPEFAVEADIAWRQDIPNMTANFTGSLRLLVGLGWPLIFTVATVAHKRKTGRFLGEVVLDSEHSIEVVGLLAPILYFLAIWWKATLTVWDGAVLTALYLVYLFILNRMPPQDHEEVGELDAVPRRVMGLRPGLRGATIAAMFLGGGLILYFVTHPFVDSLKGLAVTVGIGEFVFIQWVAPFLSEFPEKVSAFYWARTVKFSPMAVMNMVSSTINQWTVLIAMIPMVYCISLWRIQTIQFDEFQRWEIILTVVQSLYGVTILLKMRITLWDATSLFFFWFFQFATPTLRFHAMGAEFGTHQVMTVVYIVAAIAQLVYYRKQLTFGKNLIKTWRKHVSRTMPPSPERGADDGLPHELK